AAGEQTEALTMFLSDGVHLTKEGYELVYNELIAAIARHYPELRHDKLTEAFTLKDDVDPDDPRGTASSILRESRTTCTKANLLMKFENPVEDDTAGIRTPPQQLR
ncbi:12922_t:CDS:2, partial [Acaulospora colombiana]